jgi:hypothetical protein
VLGVGVGGEDGIRGERQQWDDGHDERKELGGRWTKEEV